MLFHTIFFQSFQVCLDLSPFNKLKIYSHLFWCHNKATAYWNVSTSSYWMDIRGWAKNHQVLTYLSSLFNGLYFLTMTICSYMWHRFLLECRQQSVWAVPSWKLPEPAIPERVSGLWCWHDNHWPDRSAVRTSDWRNIRRAVCWSVLIVILLNIPVLMWACRRPLFSV